MKHHSHLHAERPVTDYGSACARREDRGAMPGDAKPRAGVPPPAHAAARAPHVHLLLLASGMVGVQFCWAVQVGYVTKALLELGLAARFVSYAWLAGPIAGIFVQPIVGLMSDRCASRFGRRRPFLVAGAVAAAVCLLLFAYAAQLGVLLGDPPLATSHDGLVRHRALLVAILAFWALDFAINAAQGPLRALLADVVPPAQHKLGNSYFALASGLGNCFGSLLGSFRLSRWFVFFPGDLQGLYTIAVVVLFVTMGITVIFVKETPIGYAPVSDGSPPVYDSMAQPAAWADSNAQRVGFFEAARTAPYPFFHTFVVQCFTWFSWFTMFVFATSWVGAEVFNGEFTAAEGTPERVLYDRGVRMGNLGISLQAVLTVFSSLALPAVMRRFTVQQVYVASHVVLAGALGSALLLHHQWQAWIAVGLLASTGFSWAVTMAIPWSLMSEAVSKAAPQLAGVYFTMFNLSQCLPEVVVSLVSEEIERLTKSQAAVLGIGGAFSLAAAVVIGAVGLGKGARLDDGEEAEETAERNGVGAEALA